LLAHVPKEFRLVHPCGERHLSPEHPFPPGEHLLMSFHRGMCNTRGRGMLITTAHFDAVKSNGQAGGLAIVEIL
jgi:hypothetical protein